MLDLKFIRENADAVRHAIEVKRVGLDLDALLELDRVTLALRQRVEAAQAERNANAKLVPKASPEERPALIQKGKDLGEELKALEPELREKQEALQALLLRVPNIPLADVPVGVSDEDNVELRREGTVPQFDFEPKDHVALLEARGWAEFERVGKVSGSRSYMLRGDMALLEMALLNFAMNFLAGKGFTPLSASALVRPETLVATGHFPGGEDQVYRIEDEALMLAGTAEVPVNYLHSGEILSVEQLPINYAAISAAFRSEAGSAGRDVRGLIRVHEFKKVEQYVICAGDLAVSQQWFQILLANAEEMLRLLELPYRVIQNCTGDMGAGKVYMYDIECWVPSEGRYRETHSCSNLGDWQARRTGIRYRDAEGKLHYPHTLNNTAIATPRLLVPFVEVHQTAEGRIRIPEALRPYMGGRTEI
ncbi:seryl-tRNA synthetase [Deinobacterium chartae]|uniref:Serine--tRNA ligase n=1 Tax=Deinobacterium chartae TaxID=521158 RepID=A0A841I359_9DEIO|nr:serine--tRNA ligase [Deinobacterium chartae]MBB6099464.1 seryl-tRNA synthetase [Deinobacterium chartae]